jgi:ureidoglycolate hydrolase
MLNTRFNRCAQVIDAWRSAGVWIGVGFRKGVWHHSQISLDEVCDYLVIDRKGPESICEEWVLERQLFIDKV